MNTKSISAALLMCLVIASSSSGANYSIADIGSFTASGINNSGEAVGTAYIGYSQRAVTWDSTNGLRDLGSLATGYDSKGVDINDAGQVTGWSYVGVNNPHAFRWSSSSGMLDLGTLSGDLSSWGSAIDHNGNVYGISVDAHRVQSVFEWVQGSGMVDLAFPMQYGIATLYANDAGQIAGIYSSGNGYHAFFRDATSGFQDLGTLGGPNSYVSGINNMGQIVGTSDTTPSGDERAFLWDSSHGMQEIGIPIARGINDLGQIVGALTYWTGDNYTTLAGIWEEGSGFVELPSLGDGSSYAYAINNLGQIVGWSNVAPGVNHAVLWTPVPEPSSLLALAGGLAGMGASLLRRRR